MMLGVDTTGCGQQHGHLYAWFLPHAVGVQHSFVCATTVLATTVLATTGTYNDAVASDTQTCKPCPEGTTTDKMGADDQGDCKRE